MPPIGRERVWRPLAPVDQAAVGGARLARRRASGANRRANTVGDSRRTVQARTLCSTARAKRFQIWAKIGSNSRRATATTSAHASPNIKPPSPTVQQWQPASVGRFAKRPSTHASYESRALAPAEAAIEPAKSGEHDRTSGRKRERIVQAAATAQKLAAIPSSVTLKRAITSACNSDAFGQSPRNGSTARTA